MPKVKRTEFKIHKRKARPKQEPKEPVHKTSPYCLACNDLGVVECYVCWGSGECGCGGCGCDDRCDECYGAGEYECPDCPL